MKRYFFPLLAGIAAGICSAVAAVNSAGEIASCYTAKSYGVAEGLSSQRAYKVCCDRMGAVWIATIDGVDRWNGRTMKHYELTSDQKFSDASGRTTSLFFDHEQRIYAYDNAGRIYRFDALSDRFDLFLRLADHAGDGLTVNAIRIDRRSVIWIGLDDGLCRFDPRTGHLERILDERFVTDILELPQGMFVASIDGISVFSPDGSCLRHLCEGEYIQHLYTLPDARLLFAGTFGNGLHVFDMATWELCDTPGLRQLPHTPVRSMLALDERTLLVGFDGDGVYAVDPISWQATPRFTRSNGLLKAMGVYSMCLDREGNIWISTYAGGVTMLTPEEHPVLWLQQPVPGIEGLADNNVNALMEIRPGELWIGTDDGVNIYDMERNSWRQILDGRVCIGIACNRQRNLVAVGTYGNGLYVYDRHQRSVTHYLPGNSPLQSNCVVALTYDDSENLWMAQLDSSVLVLEPSGRWRKSDVAWARSLCELGDSTLAAGMVDGVALMDKHSGEARKLIDASSISDHDVNLFVQALVPAGDNRLWLGTDGGGLYRLDPSTCSYQQVTTDNRLPSNRVYSLVFDRNDNLWIGTDHGLSCMMPDSNRLIYNLNYRSEMRRSFNRSAALLLSDGRIAMGSTSGLLIFNPDIVHSKHEPHALRLTDFRIANIDEDETRSLQAVWNRMLESGSIRLSHRHNSFSFNLESISYRYGDDVAYQYCLEGFDGEWSLLSREEHVQYKNLPPGSYLFRVRSYSINSGAQLDERSVGIVIRPPWWLRWWAWALYGAIIVAGACSLWRYKRRKLQMRYMNEKMNFFVSIAHDIRTPLTLVQAPLDILDMNGNLDGNARHQLGLARRSLHKLLEMLSQLFEVERMDHPDRKPQCVPIALRLAIDEITTAFVPLCQHEGIALQVGEVAEGLHVDADMGLLTRILNNLLSNAVKYTPSGGWVRLDVAASHHTVRISVADNGIGIAADEQQKLFTSFFRASNAVNSQASGVGLGLLQAKRFARLLGGDVTFTSQEGKGSTFTLSLRQSEGSRAVDCEEPPVEEPIEEPEPSSARDTILVVEDNADLRRFLYELFSPTYRVVSRGDAAAALEYLETEYPSIILSDVMMIGMQGDEMCRMIKNNPVTAGIPVLLLTAKATSKAMIEGLEMGADDYITKPFDVAVLKAKVHMHIANRHRLHRYYGRIALSRDDAASIVGETDANIQPNEADCDFVKKAREIVEKHLGDAEFDIRSLCLEMAMCRTLFYERLKMLVGQTPQEFIRMIRLDHAERLLSQGEAVIDVALKTGFVNVKYFSTVFKKHYGVPPSKYHAK
ncbi:ATP-binding protein [Alistipes sp.]|uniref:hybrid sensor histidine kinase/response regulator transcription factor n=1 Tax=Alistipes sp. TaxID=1872444 RepID=UPI0025BF0183|nr:ATP-binding protein [Alistipes sp.]